MVLIRGRFLLVMALVHARVKLLSMDQPVDNNRDACSSCHAALAAVPNGVGNCVTLHEEMKRHLHIHVAGRQAKADGAALEGPYDVVLLLVVAGRASHLDGGDDDDACGEGRRYQHVLVDGVGCQAREVVACLKEHRGVCKILILWSRYCCHFRQCQYYSKMNAAGFP